MKRSTEFIACAFFLASTGLARAATITAESGQVLVDYGGGFLPVLTPNTDVFPGTQVQLRPGATAVLTYGTCKVRIGDQKVWMVERAPPCPEGTNFVDLTASAAPPVDSTTLVIGGVLVGGGIAAAIALSGDDDSGGSGGPSNGRPISAE